MRGIVKFFNSKKGWGIVTDPEGKDVFIHQSNILMDGFRTLDRSDFVNFEVGTGNDGKEQAVNVIPVLTLKMVKDSLKEDNLHIGNIIDAYGVKKYWVIDQNKVLRSSEDGMTFLELAAYAGFEVESVA